MGVVPHRHCASPLRIATPFAALRGCESFRNNLYDGPPRPSNPGDFDSSTGSEAHRTYCFTTSQDRATRDARPARHRRDKPGGGVGCGAASVAVNHRSAGASPAVAGSRELHSAKVLPFSPSFLYPDHPANPVQNHYSVNAYNFSMSDRAQKGRMPVYIITRRLSTQTSRPARTPTPAVYRVRVARWR